MLRRGMGHINLSANDRPFAKQGVVGKQLETIFARVLKNHAHQVYRDGNNLPDVLEIHGLALLEDDLVLVFNIDEPNFKPGNAVAIGHFAKEYELVVANWVLGSVDGLNYIYDARHSRQPVENYPVADNRGEQNWRYMVHFESILSVQTRIKKGNGNFILSRRF
jgi:hypothetical protein